MQDNDCEQKPLLLKWTRKKPTEAGLYLRSNPPISFLAKVDVFIGLKPGVLVVPNPEDIWNGTPVTDLPDRFWWYGPIPQPPWKDRGELTVLREAAHA